jgi:hypothetical protein
MEEQYHINCTLVYNGVWGILRIQSEQRAYFVNLEMLQLREVDYTEVGYLTIGETFAEERSGKRGTQKPDKYPVRGRHMACIAGRFLGN